MSDVIFPTDASIPTKATPIWADKLLWADSADAWETVDIDISTLPISTATQTALNAKQDTLVSLTNIRTINGESLLGSTNLNISSGYNWVTVWQTWSGADYICDWTADDIQIQEAITAMNAAGGGIVFIMEWTYDITGQIIGKNNVIVLGAGIEATILQGGIAAGYVFYNSTSQTISNFVIEDLTIDNENVATVAGVGLNKALRCVIRNVKFTNNTQFMLTLGVNNAAWPIDCFNNVIEKCVFDNHAGTYEMFLLMNSSWTRITDCTFTNKTDAEPTLGLYQLCEYTTIDRCHFIDNEWFVYYSLSCNNTKFINCEFKNSSGIKGANLSDNGAFGEVAVRDLSIINCTFEWGANSTASTAIQLGATDGATIAFNTISEYNIGLNFDDGNTWVSVLATNFKVIGNTFYNNTASNTAHSINDAILFSAIGWSCYGTIVDNKFFDTQGTPTQRYPIGFTGAFTWDYIDIVGNRMSAYSGGTSIVLTSSAALGSNVNIYKNSAYSGSSPAETTTFSGANTWDETAARIATINHWTSAKTSLVDADEITGQDSAASFWLIRTTWTNVKVFLKTYFDTLYVALTWNQTIAGDKTFSGKIISSNATSLEIANGGGSTPSAINIGWGGIYVGQNNGSLRVRSWFSWKLAQFQDSGSTTQFTIDLDTGKVTFLTSANKPAWSCTLVAGTVTVSNTIVTASSKIMFSRKTIGGTVGNISYTLSAGTSFTLNSDNAADTSTFDYIIFN